MRYAVLLYVDADLPAGPGAAEWDESLPGHHEYGAGPGVLSGIALHDRGSATSLRFRDGQRLVSDGPFAETKEQLWGLYVVEAPDLDRVLDQAETLWEARHGTIEIRPILGVYQQAVARRGDPGSAPAA
jgi:hypothetical protein